MGASRGASTLLIPVLALAVVVLFGLSVWLWTVAREPGNDSAEAGFARDMSAHHAQAVTMSEIVRDRTESERIETLATDIALTQQAQIGQMQGWLDLWGLPAAGTEPPMAWMGMPMEGPMPGMATQKEVNALREMPLEEMSEQYLRLMIPHHKAAIPMANAVLERTDNPAVERFAEAVIAAQRAEIETMQQMLQERGVPVGNEGPSDMEGMDMPGQG